MEVRYVLKIFDKCVIVNHIKIKHNIITIIIQY